MVVRKPVIKVLLMILRRKKGRKIGRESKTQRNMLKNKSEKATGTRRIRHMKSCIIPEGEWPRWLKCECFAPCAVLSGIKGSLAVEGMVRLDAERLGMSYVPLLVPARKKGRGNPILSNVKDNMGLAYSDLLSPPFPKQTELESKCMNDMCTCANGCLKPKIVLTFSHAVQLRRGNREIAGFYHCSLSLPIPCLHCLFVSLCTPPLSLP
jgi:hypothetical protein